MAARLADERARTLTQIAGLRRDFDEIVASAELANTDDEHDPEGTTIAYERAKTTALLTSAEALLTELDAAAARLAVGTYGHCAGCGRPIATERLQALPTTTACRDCAAVGRT